MELKGESSVSSGAWLLACQSNCMREKHSYKLGYPSGESPLELLSFQGVLP